MREVLALVACVLTLLAAAPAHADDAAWDATASLQQGPLYVVTENSTIALDHELLVLEDHVTGQVSAIFQFRNTSDQPLTVEAGFPIQLDFKVDEGHEKNGFAVGKDEKNSNPVYDVYVTSEPWGIDPRLLKLAGLKVRAFKEEEGNKNDSSYIRAAEFVKKRVEKPVPARPPFQFSIEQDGKPVKLTSMVIELDPAARPPIVFHFRHQLVFAPRATSVVRVRYRAPTLSGVDYGSEGMSLIDRYTWKYVLHTGATWKGPIGKLVLAVPLDGQCVGEDRWQALGTWGGHRIFTRPPFEPTTADNISCTWLHADDESESDAPARPWSEVRRSPRGVTGVRASSSMKFVADVFSDCCKVTGAPNTAEAAFDGLVVTAWSEGAKKDAGEYLELELTQPAAGLRLMSGFLGARHPPPAEPKGTTRPALPANLYTLNSRPRKLELVSVDGTRKWTLPVADKRGRWNVFPILVPAGKYRLVIQETYRGKKWQDTSIGEVAFNTSADVGWLEALRKDAFFGAFFADGAAFDQPYALEPGATPP